MRFGGFQPFTLTDFPGRVAAIAFTRGCNFRCPWCHNGDLLGPACNGKDPSREQVEADQGDEQVLAFLHARRRRLDGLVLTGGEPTIQPDLGHFIARVKDFGLQVKLDTNGARPDVLQPLLAEGLLDFVAMDVKAPLEKYETLAGCPVDTGAITRSMDLIARSGVEHLFRTTRVIPMLAEHDIAAIRALIPHGSSWITQPFDPARVLEPACLD